MQPFTTPTVTSTNATCTVCDGDLQGNPLRCLDCVRAAHQAVREARRQTVRPSDVTRARERLRERAAGSETS
jgi:hypothetical protein